MKLKKRYIALYLMAIFSATLFQANRMTTNAARMAAMAEVTTGSSVKELITSLETVGGTARQQRRGETFVEFSPRFGNRITIEHNDDSLISYQIQDGSDHFTGPPFPFTKTQPSPRDKALGLTFATLFNSLVFSPFLLLTVPLSTPIRIAVLVISIFDALFIFGFWLKLL
jgi:hypothetical protein